MITVQGLLLNKDIQMNVMRRNRGYINFMQLVSKKKY